MISGKKFYSRRVFVLHGMLLFAVVVVSYFSVRAQYEALRDQRYEEARNDQQLAVRVVSITLQNQFQLLARSLADYDSEQPIASQIVPANWLSALGVADAKGSFEMKIGDGDAFARLIAQQPGLARTKSPVALVTSEGRIVLAVPRRRGDGRVLLGTISPDQITQDIQGVSQRSAPGTAGLPSMVLISFDGRILAGPPAFGYGERIQSQLAPALVNPFNALLSMDSTASQLTPAVGTSLLAFQPLVTIPGMRLRVVSVRTNVHSVVSDELRPLFWQMITQVSVILIAAAIVIVSTTVSLMRGRQRIEKLRTDMINRDLAKARRIQLNWLPAPVFDGPLVHIAADNRPALHISGDFYNWFELTPTEEDRSRKTAVVIGDVSGHGVPAAFLMANTQMLVRSTLPTCRDPARCLEAINKQLCGQVFSGQFVTMMILVIDHDTAGLEIASAGHHAPMLRRGDKVECLPIDPQLVVGVDDTVEYQTQRFLTRPGDTFLLYTDGAIELTNPAGEQFRVDRLGQAFTAAAETPQELVAAITRTLDTFRKEVDPEDDLTLLVAQIMPTGVEATDAENAALSTRGC